MKKVLSLLMMAMLAVGAWAAEESIELTAEAQGYANGDLVTTVQGDVVTLTFDKANSSTAPAYYSTGDAVRLYNGGTMTITAGGNTITQVVFVYELNGSATVSVTPGTYDESSKTWTGSATEVVMTAGTAKHVRISKVTVTYEVGEIPAIAAPVISGETPFTESSEVTITCETEGTTIYYTTDGGDPTNEDAIYAGPFPIYETTTVKAIAYDATGAASSVATKEFVKEVPVVLTNVATVAEFKALADDTEFTFTGNLVVGAQSGAYLYLQDSTDGMLVYGTIDQTYNRLAEVPGGWTATKTTFKGAPEAAEPAGFAASTWDVDLAPEEMTIAQITLDNAFEYAVIRGATVIKGSGKNGTIIVDEATVAMYNRFNVDIPTDGNVYDIVGITGYYDVPQFMPLEFVAQGVEVATPVISGETPFIENTEVTITCETEGVSIHYTLDGTDPTINSTLYTEPFTLTESATVKAVAFAATGEASAVASMQFVKTTTVATVAEFNDLEEGVTFVFTGNLVVSGQAGQRLYAQDETGGVLLYGNAGQGYSFGDVIPAGFGAKKALYNGDPEMTNMTGMQAATETAELVAQEIAINQYAANQNIYAVVKGATVDGNTLVIGEETLATYNRFGVTFPTDDKIYDVYGVTTIYNGNAQLLPLEFVEHVEPVTGYDEFYLVGTFNDWSQETGMIAFTGNEAGDEYTVTTELDAGAEFKVITPDGEGWKWFGGLDENNVGYFLINDDINEVGLVDGANFRVEEGGEYTFTIKGMELAPEEKAVNEPLVMTVSRIQTAISTINAGNVKAVRYYNLQGVESANPFQGVNIVVSEMTDGSKNVTKMVK
ncbi:MAG: chitobiase/beta-hexosaminidase C-terminal domain-containing protein [Muribaculaceae bacterium]|nr:chitobiase/beta-hexosaminidase C-terminal domain-containing protein [Muribaculaceae bacterium]